MKSFLAVDFIKLALADRHDRDAQQLARIKLACIRAVEEESCRSAVGSASSDRQDVLEEDRFAMTVVVLQEMIGVG